jgi:hypothetical protein
VSDGVPSTCDPFVTSAESSRQLGWSGRARTGAPTPAPPTIGTIVFQLAESAPGAAKVPSTDASKR